MTGIILVFGTLLLLSFVSTVLVVSSSMLSSQISWAAEPTARAPRYLAPGLARFGPARWRSSPTRERHAELEVTSNYAKVA